MYVILLLGLLFAPGLADAPDLPDTPAGRAAAAFFHALDDGGDPAFQAFVEQYLAAGLRAVHPMDRHLAMLRDMSADLGGADVIEFEEEGPAVLHVTLLTPDGVRRTLTFLTETAPPYGLAGIEAGEVPNRGR